MEDPKAPWSRFSKCANFADKKVVIQGPLDWARLLSLYGLD